jgi:hypothetical protein
MTDNTAIKTDATELLAKLKAFKSRHGFVIQTKPGSAIDTFEKEIRLILKVVRTDEENQEQSKVDSYC